MAKKNKTATPSFLPDPRAKGGNSLTPAEQAALVEGCMNLCRKLARKAAGTVPGADVDDLEGEALLACVEASREWQPDCDSASGVGSSKFSTFATVYIGKRLLGLADDQRKNAAAVRPEDWEAVAGPDREPLDELAENDGPSEDDRELLVKLDEPARTPVRLVTFENVSPEQAAVQLGKSVKDLKLILRNAAKELIRQKARQSTPSMFAAPALAEAV